MNIADMLNNMSYEDQIAYWRGKLTMAVGHGDVDNFIKAIVDVSYDQGYDKGYQWAEEDTAFRMKAKFEAQRKAAKTRKQNMTMKGKSKGKGKKGKKGY